ncbi:MAG: anhydro-N-acetylmuramic acid kinase [Pseudomonadales bacterium]
MSELYIGLMSGTSVDGIDAALVDLSRARPHLITTHCEPIAKELRKRIAALCTPGDYEIDRLGPLDRELGACFADATSQLLRKANLTADSIKAIGSHGQTVRHRPPASAAEPGFTLQIGDPNVIAEHTGICTVADFRRRNIAAGGQGAPLAPAFHAAIAPHSIQSCVFLNLGGIANITSIFKGELRTGFDTGPANGLMDAWIELHRGVRYDRNGEWAASGNVNAALLDALQTHPYFSLPAPKSTGRETFNLAWLQNTLSDSIKTLDANDVQATLVQLGCKTITRAIAALDHSPDAVFACGGGAHNIFFMEQLRGALQEKLPHCKLADTSELGIAPDWIEACAFAWLAQCHIEGRRVALQRATGATHDAILGARFEA